jgi:phospholipid/cholesterol/gamma-HCH transport system substrate-binding protein
MASKASNFKVGLFVTAGSVVAVAAIVWLGASKYFEKASTFVTYFNESVQGLQVDSNVKYLGVEVGRVAKIRVAPDYRLIEVVMKIDFPGAVDENIVAQLKTAGITGIVFVELDRRSPDEPDLSPPLDFTSDYPVIPSRPSELSQLLTSLGDVVAGIKQVDFKGISQQLQASIQVTESLIRHVDELVGQMDPKGISDQVKSTLLAAETLLGGKQTGAILGRLEAAAVHLESATSRVDRAVGDRRIEGVLAETQGVLKEVRDFVSDLHAQVRQIDLAQTTNRATRLIEDVERRTQATVSEIQATSESLRRASESLEQLLDRLSASPSDLIFSRPPTPGGRRP